MKKIKISNFGTRQTCTIEHIINRSSEYMAVELKSCIKPEATEGATYE